MQKKKGISLIVLVITIIVMIILAAAVVITLTRVGVINRAGQATEAMEIKQLQNIASLLWAEAYDDGARTQAELEEAVLDGLNDVKGVNLDDYTITVTERGVTLKKIRNTANSSQLSAPTIAISENILTITDNAANGSNTQKFDIYIGSEKKATIAKTETTKYYLIKLNLEIGTYSVTVKAVANGYTDSALSNQVSYIVEPGLYDEYGAQLASWDALGNNYGLDVTKNYTLSNYMSESTSLYYILANNTALSKGVNLIVPDDVTSIGDYAFYSCSNLTSVMIPDGVTSIGKYAFGACNLLPSVTIPDSVTSIDNYAFYNCTGMADITIGSGVTNIGRYVLSNCTNLSSISVDSDNAIYHSTSNCVIQTASKTLVVGCNNSVIPADGSVTSIGKYAFYGCSNLTNVIIPDSVTSIGDYAFFYGTNLNKVTLGSGVTSIGPGAFGYCSNLTSVVIPDTVTSIGMFAFQHCTSLNNVTIGSGVTKISKNCFNGCTNLNSVNFKDATTWYYTTSSTSTSGGTELNVTDASAAAEYLRSTYADKYWYKL